MIVGSFLLNEFSHYRNFDVFTHKMIFMLHVLILNYLGHSKGKGAFGAYGDSNGPDQPCALNLVLSD